MARELRIVSKDWVHPKTEDGRYIPLLANTYSEDLMEWHHRKRSWEQGLIIVDGSKLREKTNEEKGLTFESFYGEIPNPGSYMPLFDKAKRTHLQIYENTSEGTPLSPVFSKNDFELLLEWASKHLYIFAYKKGTAENWRSLLLNNNSNIQINGLQFI